jgi:hypothetical protein
MYAHNHEHIKKKYQLNKLTNKRRLTIVGEESHCCKYLLEP